MSSIRHFIKAHRFELIAFPVLTIEFYVWWRMQQSERWGKKEDPSGVVTTTQFAKSMFNELPSTETDLKKSA